MGVLGDLVDQRAQRLRKACIVECGAPLTMRRLAVSLKDPLEQCFASLSDIGHVWLHLDFLLHVGIVLRVDMGSRSAVVIAAELAVSARASVFHAPPPCSSAIRRSISSAST